jgi:uroporphyrinogen-III synthase
MPFWRTAAKAMSWLSIAVMALPSAEWIVKTSRSSRRSFFT